MSMGNGNPVLHACYLENIDLVNNNKACFLGKIKDMVLNKLGFSESWQNQGSNQPKNLLRQMCKRVRNIYQLHWRTNVHNPDPHNKLRIYMKFKHSFRYENYLSIMTKFHTRKLFTKLRISAHDLLIEHGIYHQPKVPVEDRLCTSCKVIDGEIHFVMACTAQNGFTRPRQLMLQNVSDECPGFTNMDVYDKFICIMTPNYEMLCKITEKFLINMVNIRGHQ